MALTKLRDFFRETHRDAFMKMLDSKIHVVEKLSASSFHVKKDALRYKFYKSGQTESINIIDRTIVKFYEPAIAHIKGLNNSVKEAMPSDWKFGFDYMIDGDTPNFKYSMLPKNNLVLTHIQVLHPVTEQVQKVIRDTQVLNKWADLLEVQRPPIVFEGQLRYDQKQALIKMLEMTDTEFAKVYESRSFTKDMFAIFNSDLRRSMLQESLDASIDGLVISFIDGKKMSSFKLEDFRTINEERAERKSSDIYQITIIDLIEYLSDYDFKQHKLIKEKKDRRFLELMSEVFNTYIKENAAKYIGVDFDVAEFAKKESFKLNTNFIENQQTLKYIENDVLAELFKIVLSSFKNKRQKTTDILSEDMVNQMNSIIKNIQEHVDGEISENDVLDFNSYMHKSKINDLPEVNEGLNVKYPKQGAKLVYMFVGRFQPFTLGHEKVVNTIHQQNGYPVVIFLVKSKTSKKEDAFKRPYDEATQMAMLNKLKRELPIEEVFIIDRGAIDVMFNEMRPKYEPVLWGTGTDRLSTYSYQVDKPQYREELNCREDFQLFEIPRTGQNISATQVRETMLDGDEKMFRKLTPRAIHCMYDELKSNLEQSMAMSESNNTVLTFEQFIKNI